MLPHDTQSQCVLSRHLQQQRNLIKFKTAGPHPYTTHSRLPLDSETRLDRSPPVHGSGRAVPARRDCLFVPTPSRWLHLEPITAIINQHNLECDRLLSALPDIPRQSGHRVFFIETGTITDRLRWVDSGISSFSTLPDYLPIFSSPPISCLGIQLIPAVDTCSTCFTWSGTFCYVYCYSRFIQPLNYPQMSQFSTAPVFPGSRTLTHRRCH